MTELIAKFAGCESPAQEKATLYALGALRQSSQARNQFTASTCGFFGSNFLEWESEQAEKLKLAEQLTPYRVKTISEHLREAAAQAGNNSLVKGRKSRTEGKKQFYAASRFRNRMKSLEKSLSVPLVFNPEKYHRAPYSATFADVAKGEVRNSNNKRSLADKKPLVKVQLQRRDWSQQTRVQQIVETPAGNAPDQNSGDRFTEKLTSRAVKNIFESGAYVAIKHGGFKTFLTLTFDSARRRRVLDGTDFTSEGLPYSPVEFKQNFADPVKDIAGPYTAFEWYKGKARKPKLMNQNGDIAGDYCPTFARPEKLWQVIGAKTTIGAEVSKLVNALKKLRRRGFKANITERDSQSGRLYCPIPRIEASVLADPSDFHYLWVAECPANDDGEPNPHVHLLMDWDMAPELFIPWAERIEKLWGNGFAKLERIRQPKAAGTYIIKAVGYAAKGSNADQGIIRGNRYNMAACSRAPSWETLASFEAGNMAGIISELGYKLDQWKKPIKRCIKRHQKRLENSIAGMAVAKNKGDITTKNKLQRKIKWLESEIKQASNSLKNQRMHVSANNRFSITFDDNANLRVDQFLRWAAGARGWSMRPLYAEDDLADIRLQAQELYQDDYQTFLERQAYWSALLNDDNAKNCVHPHYIEQQQSLAWDLWERAATFYH
ncbi:hypothetical protein [Vibrio hangzhouensis]|uniref:Uncharacterized protein n=1 Tax=Vibrio hangzhouensis TaxID=462991 RepID=A0A1H5YDI9_9VIBR|nr:hypothetical protein [Vibrio hangzhouensis]SEG21687.1 hypothetical protein SAMN04488244_10914 [Vibrio hangzhouensis]